MRYSEVGKFGRVRLQRERRKLVFKTFAIFIIGSSSLAGLVYYFYPYLSFLLENLK